MSACSRLRQPGIRAGVVDLDGWGQLLREAASEHRSPPRRIAELCVEMLGVSGAGISIVSDGGSRGVVCATDELSARIEDLQVTLGEGPCVDALRGGGPVLVGDLRDPRDLETGRWPVFLAAAIDSRVQAVFAFPLRIGAIGVGALDLYRTTTGPLTPGELSRALMAAEAAAVAVLGLQVSEEVGLTDDADAGSSQAQVHQATGMVMVQLGVPIEHAFLLLRARAFSTDRPLLDVAVDVVERRIRFGQEDL